MSTTRRVDYPGWEQAYRENPDVVMALLQTRIMLEQRGIGYAELAQELGVTKQSIGHYLSHRMTTDPKVSRSIPRITTKMAGRDRIDAAIDTICERRGYTFPTKGA